MFDRLPTEIIDVVAAFAFGAAPFDAFLPTHRRHARLITVNRAMLQWWKERARADTLHDSPSRLSFAVLPQHARLVKFACTCVKRVRQTNADSLHGLDSLQLLPRQVSTISFCTAIVTESYLTHGASLM